MRFDLGFSLVPVLLPVSLVILLFLFRRQRYLEILLSSLVSFLITYFFGLEAAVACFSVFQVLLTLFFLVDFGKFLFWLFVFLTGFEALTIFHLSLLPFGVVSPLGWFYDLDVAMFYVVARLSPLFVIFIFVLLILKLWGEFFGLGWLRVSWFRDALGSGSSGGIVGLDPRVLLVLSVVFSVVGILYPYSPYINPDGFSVGVDVKGYCEMMESVNLDVFSAFTIDGGSRSMILFLVFLFQRASGLSTLEAVKYIPVLLNPLFALSVYFMVVKATGDREWAGMAALLSALGFTITVGVYSHFLANMLGLMLLFSAMGFLFMSVESKSVVPLSVASLLGSLVVYTHPWTFTQFFVATGLFLIYMHFKEKRFSESVRIFVYLVLTGLVNVVKRFLGGFEIYSSISFASAQLLGLASFWSNSTTAFREFYGGILSNSFLLGISVISVCLLRLKRSYHMFMISLLLASLPYYFLVDSELQTRMLYNVPFGVLASFGVVYVLRNSGLRIREKKAVLLFTITYMISYFLRAISNFI